MTELKTKFQAKTFVRGINRFEVPYSENGERQAAEVVMYVQM